ncbi:MAG: septum site-determining protein MinC [Desulfobacterales bacterium]
MEKTDPEESGRSEKAAVRIKGVGSSLWVTVDPDEPRERLRRELDRLFRALHQPAVNPRVILDAGKNRDSDDLIAELSAYLTESWGVAEVSQPPDKVSQSGNGEEGTRKRDMDYSWHHQQTEVLLLSGRIRSGQKVNAVNHLVILGDVNPGAEVLAGGDILILGSLLGTAIAGQPDNEEAIVLALDFRPTQVQIGSYVAAGPPSSPGKMIEFAHVEKGRIVVEKYLEANPFGRLPWPVVR